MPHPKPVWLHKRTVMASGRRIDLKDKDGNIIKKDYFAPDPRGRYPLILVTPAENRRRMRHILEYLDPDKVYEIIENAKFWPYKGKHFVIDKEAEIEKLQRRDLALLAMIFLTGGRIHEVLMVTKSQFDFSELNKFILLKEFYVGKRKIKTLMEEGETRIDIPLPTVGSLSRFTDIMMDYYIISDEKMFNISTQRAWAIVKHMTGLWCHYFRSQRLSHIVNAVRSALIASRITGIKNVETIRHYYRGDWKDHLDKLLE